MNFPVSMERLPASHEYFDEIIALCIKADEYIRALEWCGNILERGVYFSLGKVFTVFLYLAEDVELGIVNPSWIIIGDLPTAGLNTVENDSLIAALERYSDYAEDWAFCAIRGDFETECYPFDEERTPELGSMLLSRVQFIRGEIIPNVDDIELERSAKES